MPYLNLDMEIPGLELYEFYFRLDNAKKSQLIEDYFNCGNKLVRPLQNKIKEFVRNEALDFYKKIFPTNVISIEVKKVLSNKVMNYNYQLQEYSTNFEEVEIYKIKILYTIS